MELKLRDYLKSWNVILFKTDHYAMLKEISSWPIAIVALLIAVSFQAFPISQAEIPIYQQTFQYFLIKYIVITLIIFLIAKLLGSKIALPNFIASISITYTYATILTLILFVLSRLIFELVFNIPVVSGLVQSSLPFYTSLIFAWGCENLFELQGKVKPTLIGLLSLILLYLYIILSDILLCGIGFTNIFGVGQILCGA